jgi:hypothetical protein
MPNAMLRNVGHASTQYSTATGYPTRTRQRIQNLRG